MQWHIYFALFFCLVNSSNIPFLESIKKLKDRLENDDSKTILARNRELYFTTNNENPIGELNAFETIQIPEKLLPMVLRIFSGIIDIMYIHNVITSLERMEDVDTSTIISKLKKFSEWEIISPINFVQIWNDDYPSIPNIMVEIVSKLHKGFYSKANGKKDIISIGDFSSVIDEYIKNRDIAFDIIVRLYDCKVKYVNYEAWLFKKRIDIEKLQWSGISVGAHVQNALLWYWL
ncbi:uncharacterized protein LOC126906543 [Daktulosphaira vitifoliae]|uniref:uncharacterized protein LOC126906543 n=1 Tax=Daktulosphaira vitifoliae TaxID=58002 RepID=UPI0021AA9037|nr:uncharacterized protein LOC126906543 [Daktulosphaira vitifoliae]